MRLRRVMEDSAGDALRFTERACRIGAWIGLLAMASAEAGGAAQDLRDSPPRGTRPAEAVARDSIPTTASNQSVSVDEGPSVQPDPPEAAGGAQANPSNTESSNLSDAEAGRLPTSNDSGNSHQTLLRGQRKRSPSDIGFDANDARSAPWYRTGLGALAVVLALIGVVFVLARRWLPSARIGSDHGIMRVAGRLAISPRQSLVLVRVGKRFVLVGVSPERVNAVCEIADAEEVAELVSQADVKGASGFATWLNREAADYLRRPGEAEKVVASEGEGPGGASKPLKDLLGRLRNLQMGPRT